MDVWDPGEVMNMNNNYVLSLQRILAVHEEMEKRGMESPFGDWVARANERPSRPERPTTTRIHVSDFFEARDNALRAHATQIDPEGFFFAIPRELEVAIWPTEEFELAESRVETEIPEDDLFAGIRGILVP